ncbi:MAG: aminotransferase class I/II-fold pyridoxal phosphate-dependent enzyme [Gemmatimonadaceae bacterium]
MPNDDASATPEAPLTLSPDEMRRLGYRVVDEIIAHLGERNTRPVANARPRADLEASLGSFRDAPTAPDAIMDLVCREIMPSVTQVDHPRFFAFVPGPGNFVGAMADALAAGFNVFCAHWLHGSGAATVELQTIEWLCRECGLPATAGGLFVSGGSMANLTALAAARRVVLGGPDARAVVYASSQTHNSLAKGLRVIGFTQDQIRTIETDDGLRLSLPALERAIAADIANGRRPFCVVANAGTTNTAAVDPWHGIADLCVRHGLWMHVDGAYGAAAVLTPQGRAALAGIERADSITFDPHKWLFQPFEIGCVLVRDLRHLRQAFTVHVDDHGEYLEDVLRRVGDEMMFYEHGVQLTRSFRALKLWMTLRVFGVQAVRDAIARGIELAELTERLLRADGRFAIVTPAQLGMVSFVPVAGDIDPAAADAWVTRVADGVLTDGFAMVTSTKVFDRQVLRMCTINPRTTDDEIRDTVTRIGQIADAVR